MPVRTKDQLKAELNTTFFENPGGGITPALVQTFMIDVIDSIPDAAPNYAFGTGITGGTGAASASALALFRGAGTAAGIGSATGITGTPPVFTADFTALSSLPTGMSFSRASNAMVFDSTGKLTYAPNNLLLQSNNFSDAAWTKDQTGTISATGMADPIGGTAASTFTAGASGGRLYQNAINGLLNTTNGLSVIWLRRRTGTGQVSMFNSAAAPISITITGTWAQYALVVAGGSGNGYAGIQLATNGDAVDIYAPTLSAVTYETTPRSADQVITAGSPYYGPRFDHAWNGSAWVVKGLLIEEQRANLFLGSNDFSDATQVFNNTSRTANATTSPDGTTNAIKLVESASNSEHRTYQPCSTGNGTTGILACFAKKAERNWIGIRNVAAGIVANFNLNTGVVGTSANCTPLIIDCGNGWYLCIIIGTIFDFHIINIGDADTGTSSGYSYVGDGTSGVYLYGGTIQQGGFWTSYIPATSAAVTRSADIAALAGTALTTVQAAAYSIIVETNSIPATNIFAQILWMDNNTSFIQMYPDPTHIYSDNMTPHAATAGSGDLTGMARSGAAVDTSAGISIVLNGGTVVDGTWDGGSAFPSNIGARSNGVLAMCAYVTKIAIYSSRLSDADLQTKSVVGASF